jgi:hypothetical protein
MSKLNFTIDELLKLFPLKLDNLDVYYSYNDLPGTNVENINIIYYQKNTDDDRRNWDDYNKWLIEFGGKNDGELPSQKLPSSIDKLYDKYYHLFEKGSLKKEDKLVLNISLQAKSDKSVYLMYIRRNKDEEFKKLGEKTFLKYKNLLKEKGFEYIYLIPVDDKKEYWKNLGFAHVINENPSKQNFLRDKHITPTHHYQEI